MVNQRDDLYFENKLLDELRTFAHCSNIKNDPYHFCSQREFRKNLQMSFRNVSYYLHRLVLKGIVKHERDVVYKGKRRDRFTIINQTSKNIVKRYEEYVNRELADIGNLASKMRKTPSLYNCKKERLPIPVYLMKDYPDGIPKDVKFGGGTSTTGKSNKKGYEYLEHFCREINLVFHYVDSLSYSQLAGNIKQDSEHDKMINDLRKHVFQTTQKCINHALRGLEKVQKEMIGQALIARIPTMYQILNIERYAKL